MNDEKIPRLNFGYKEVALLVAKVGFLKLLFQSDKLKF